MLFSRQVDPLVYNLSTQTFCIKGNTLCTVCHFLFGLHQSNFIKYMYKLSTTLLISSLLVPGVGRQCCETVLTVHSADSRAAPVHVCANYRSSIFGALKSSA